MNKLIKWFSKTPTITEAAQAAINGLPKMRQGAGSTGGGYNIAAKLLAGFLGDVPVSKVSPADIVNFIDHEEARGLKQSTVLAYYTSLKSIFREAVKAGHIEETPCKTIYKYTRDTGAKEHISLEDMDRMISAASSLRDKAIFMIQKDSAARANELRLMKKSTTTIRRYYETKGGRIWVNFGDTVPTDADIKMVGLSEVTHAKRTKGVIRFGHEACKALLGYLATRENNPLDFIWLSKQKKVIGSTSFYMVYKNAGNRLGIKNFSPHKWRHGVAIAMRLDNREMADIADLLNHKDVGLTIREYGQLNGEQKLERYLDIAKPVIDGKKTHPAESGAFHLLGIGAS